MNIEELENKMNALEDTISKMKDLLADLKICNSDITKTLISSAIKKYAATIADFKID